MGEQRVRHGIAAAAESFDGATEIDGIPERDGGGDEGECGATIRMGRCGLRTPKQAAGRFVEVTL